MKQVDCVEVKDCDVKKRTKVAKLVKRSLAKKIVRCCTAIDLGKNNRRVYECHRKVGRDALFYRCEGSCFFKTSIVFC